MIRYAFTYLDTEAGFRLAAIIAVSLLVLAILVRLKSKLLGNDNGTRDVADLKTASDLARSKLSEVGTDIPLIDCSMDGQSSNGFGWHLEIASDPIQRAHGLKRITVTVSWQTKRGVETLTVKATKAEDRNKPTGNLA